MPREMPAGKSANRGAIAAFAVNGLDSRNKCGTPAHLDEIVAGLGNAEFSEPSAMIIATNTGIGEQTKFDTFAFTYYPRLKKVAQFVVKHYPEPLPLARIAGVAGLESTYFSKYFSDRVGIGYLTWLNYFRVLIAVAIMSVLELPLTDVAFAVGFRDLRTFQRAFLKHTGDTASAIKDRLESLAKWNHRTRNESQDLTHDSQFLTHIAQIVTREPLPEKHKLKA